MTKPYIWRTTGSWITIECEKPEQVEVAVRPTLRFRKSAICTFTSGQQVTKTPNWDDPTNSPLWEAGLFKATLTVSGERFEFGFENKFNFLHFIQDLDEALRS